MEKKGILVSIEHFFSIDQSAEQGRLIPLAGYQRTIIQLIPNSDNEAQTHGQVIQSPAMFQWPTHTHKY